MYATIPAFLQPSTFLHALRANLTAEPKVLFVYALLLVVPWVVWQGLRTGEGEPYDELGGEGDETPPSYRAKRTRKKNTKEPSPRKRKKRGQITWIQ